MRKEHLQLGPGEALTFDYPAKGGARRVQAVVDPEVRDVVAALKRRRGGGPELLAWREAKGWRDVRPEDINDYLREATEHECSAKDFRTWNATMLAAVALAVSAAAATGSKTGRKRAVTRAIKEVAGYLGNTPAVCRASYIDPRVFDRFRSGWTIAGVLPEVGDLSDPEVRHAVESAVLDLLEDERGSEALERGLAEAA
jgi:DNA topoisomerase IB